MGWGLVNNLIFSAWLYLTAYKLAFGSAKIAGGKMRSKKEKSEHFGSAVEPRKPAMDDSSISLDSLTKLNLTSGASQHQNLDSSLRRSLGNLTGWSHSHLCRPFYTPAVSQEKLLSRNTPSLSGIRPKNIRLGSISTSTKMGYISQSLPRTQRIMGTISTRCRT